MRLQPVLLFTMALVATGPALAQIKVVGPDGKVTYTDRPVPPPPGGQVQPLRAAVAAAAAARAPLPLEPGRPKPLPWRASPVWAGQNPGWDGREIR